MDIINFEEYDEQGNVIDSGTIEVPVPPQRQERRAAIVEYRDAVQAILSSNVAAATKNYVRAQARLMKLIVDELKDDQ